MNKVNICVLVLEEQWVVIFGLRWEAHTHLKVHWELNMIVFQWKSKHSTKYMYFHYVVERKCDYGKEREDCFGVFQHTDLSFKICLHSLCEATGLFFKGCSSFLFFYLTYIHEVFMKFNYSRFRDPSHLVSMVPSVDEFCVSVSWSYFGLYVSRRG